MAVFTLCFCGTSCWPDEGITDHPETKSFTKLYGPAGYIPARIFADIEPGPDQGRAVIPGPGPPWVAVRSSLLVPTTLPLLTADLDAAGGHSLWDLAGHAAASVVGVPSTGRAKKTPMPSTAEVKAHVKLMQDKLGVVLNPDSSTKPPSHDCYQFAGPPWWLGRWNGADNKITTVNVIGHSRGGVAAIMVAHELKYLIPGAKVNIFAIDPVPGPGTLSKEMVELASNVDNYVGVYAIDETSSGFNGVVPWPYNGSKPFDPISPSMQGGQSISRYHLIYAPGRHATVTGNKTSDGSACLTDTEPAELVGLLVNELARRCLFAWGTRLDVAKSQFLPFMARPQKGKTGALLQKAMQLGDLKKAMTTNAAAYRKMRKFHYLGDYVAWHHNERGVTSSTSRKHGDWRYLEDVIGIEPLVKRKRSTDKPGRVAWEAIQDIHDNVFSTGRWDND